jgi:hypothetical protein
MKAVGIGLLLACVTCRAWAEDCTDPLVKKPEDAGRIAFAMWHVVNPNFTATDEHKWLSAFTISLHDCVWSVAAKPEPPRDYSTFVISIGAKDGRFLGAQISD